jgi:uncharacterized protein (TIGR03032 family)
MTSDPAPLRRGSPSAASAAATTRVNGHSPGGSGADDALWGQHREQWRQPSQIISLWEQADAVDGAALAARIRGPWWELLDVLGITLLVTREYEHLLLALTVVDGRPRTSFLSLPHPSGLAVDRERERIQVASTRNPNQLLELAPASAALARADAPTPDLEGRPLVALGSRFYPGSLYIHDLAFVGGDLHANAVGENAIVRLAADGGYERVWWPEAIERDGVPDFTRNYLQLNSIAAGATIADSYFTASTDAISARRPGHLNFPVDGRGVLYSGAAREPVVRGLTRPHSARLHGGDVWVANSGYGEIGVIHDGQFASLASLDSWTRGLTFCGDVAFVGISRVIPSYRSYAPGLDVERSRCGVVALNVRTGAVTASITWPQGNQVFAIDWISRTATHGLPFTRGRRRSAHAKHLFYAFAANRPKDDPCP